jgi:hypothetical protein
MEIIKQVGLEAEFLLRDSTGKLRYPAVHGFDTDEFFLLGELRATQGKTRQETVGNFMQAIAKVLYKASAKKMTVDFSGLTEISPTLKADVLRKMSNKHVEECKNIYGTDILNFSDDVVSDGKIVTSRISAGLHIHFSRWAYHECVDESKKTKVSWKNLLTMSQKKSIIVAMDRLLPEYDFGVPLKYRRPGFYEDKSWGFEYRSLPMIHQFIQLEKIMEVVDYAFIQLEKLDK